MKKVEMLMGVSVTNDSWKSEDEMVREVSEAETKYYGGKMGMLKVSVTGSFPPFNDK